MSASTVDRRCPVCDSAPAPAPGPAPASGTAPGSHRTVFEEHGWRVVQCTSCGMTFLANPPDYASLAEDYAWEKSYAAETPKRREREPWLHAVQDVVRPIRRSLRGNKLHSLMNAHFRGGDVLDLGCGTGHRIGKYLTASGADIRPCGIELEPGPAEIARDLFRSRGGDVLCRPGLDGLRELSTASMDGAVLYAYLEHETQPRSVLVELHRVLKPRGPVVIKVPNHASMNRRVRGRRWCGYRLPDHVNYFTPRTLRRLLTSCGFEIRRFGPRDRFPFNDNMWLVAETDEPRTQ